MAKKQELIAYKHNRVIFFGNATDIKHIDKLTKNQAKITMLSASKVNSNDTCETRYSMTFKEFSELAEISTHDYEKIYKEAKKLTCLGVDIIDKDENIIIFKWLQDVIIKQKTGIISYKLSENLLPYYKLTKETKEFTKFNLLDYMPLQSRYSIALYEFLAMWKNKGKVRCTVHQLREQLQLNKNQYQVTRNFIDWCIKKPIAEINATTKHTFKVEPEYEKGARNTVTAVTFHIKQIKLNKTEIEEIEKKVNISDIVKSISQNFNAEELSPEFKVRARKMLRK